jgi:hypothetical protein
VLEPQRPQPPGAISGWLEVVLLLKLEMRFFSSCEWHWGQAISVLGPFTSSSKSRWQSWQVYS